MSAALAHRASAPRASTRTSTRSRRGSRRRSRATRASRPSAGADALGRRQAPAAAARLPRRSDRDACRRSPPVWRSSSCTWRPSIHDDLIDGARAPTRTAGGLERPRRRRGGRDRATTCSRARSPSWRRAGDVRAVEILAEAAVSLSRGEALQNRQAHDPDTTVESYIERCGLKTGKLFEAACRLARRLRASSGSRSGSPTRSPTTSSTARATRRTPARCPAPTCGRERRPCRCCSPLGRTRSSARALAGGPLEGVLLRVAATGALEESRAVALDYAARAREALNGALWREELEALTYAAVDRTR